MECAVSDNDNSLKWRGDRKKHHYVIFVVVYAYPSVFMFCGAYQSCLNIDRVW